MGKKKFPGFKACMKLMRKHDPQKQDDGYHWLLPHAAEHVQDLIGEFRSEKDHGLRCWLLDLIGEARSPEAFPLFVEHLKGDDEDLRTWAADGLHKLGTKDARRILWEARSYTFPDEEETRHFREMLDTVKGWD